jgi:hypothetical protein
MHDLKAKVVINNTELNGVVVGRAEYIWTTPSYFVEYVDAQGNPRREWFDDYQLSLIQ